MNQETFMEELDVFLIPGQKHRVLRLSMRAGAVSLKALATLRELRLGNESADKRSY